MLNSSSRTDSDSNHPRMVLLLNTWLSIKFSVTITCSNCGEPIVKDVSKGIFVAHMIERKELLDTLYILKSSPKENVFSLTVRLSLSVSSSDTYYSLPVDTWGKVYNCATLSRQAYWVILLSTHEDVSVEISHDGTFSNDLTLNSKSAMTIEVPAATVATIKSSDKIGVIVGSYDHKQKKCIKGSADSLIAEMLTSEDKYGKDFFTLQYSDEKNNGQLIIMTSEDDTKVSLRSSRKGSIKNIQMNRYSREMVDLDESYYRISSNKPMQVFFYRNYYCPDNVVQAWATSLSIVVPTELFYYQYVISGRSDGLFKVLLICEKLFASYILMNDVVVTSVSTYEVIDQSDWQIMHSLLARGSQNIYSKIKVAFGCYFYATDKTVSFMSPAGFISSPINPRYCKKSQPVNDDLLDNDCDGKIDEEYYDQKDNDRDGKVDEDFRDLTEEQRKEKEQRESSHMSAWSEWTEWTCPRECNATDRYRTRQCHKPTPSSENCLGLANETKHGGCNVENELCPVECPEYKWSYGCRKDCENCAQDCDKFTGECESCNEGFKFPKLSCSKECAAFEFGPDCSGDCLRECWGDCDDRKKGTCHGEKWTYLVMIGGPSVVVIGFMALYCQNMKKGTEEEGGDKAMHDVENKRPKSHSVNSVLSDATTDSSKS